jgi:hypothetical protein
VTTIPRHRRVGLAEDRQFGLSHDSSAGRTREPEHSKLEPGNAAGRGCEGDFGHLQWNAGFFANCAAFERLEFPQARRGRAVQRSAAQLMTAIAETGLPSQNGGWRAERLVTVDRTFRFEPLNVATGVAA